MGVIFWFSTDEFSAGQTGSLLEPLLRYFVPEISEAQVRLIHFCLRKAAHVISYALLALLLMRAFRAGSRARWRWRWALASVVILSLYALLDEYHQSFTAQRTASVYDSALDLAGGLVALCLLWVARARKRD
jgi:VanZ family protein